MEVLFYTIAKGLARGIFGLLGPVTVLHRERSLGVFEKTREDSASEGSSGAYLLAANHVSHFDPLLISLEARREIDWMAMAELFTNRFAAAFFRLGGAFPTDRSRVDREAVRTTLRRLKLGRVVGIFPEGGIRVGEKSLLEGAPMRPGIAALAQMAKVPVVPCVVLGGDMLYTPRRWLPFRRARFWVVFGKPLWVRSDLPKEEARETLERDLAEAIRALYLELCEKHPLRPEELPHDQKARREGA